MIGLPLDNNSPTHRYAIRTGVVAIVLLVVLFGTNLFNWLKIATTSIDPSVCKVHEPIVPQSFYRDNSTVLEVLHGDQFRKQSIAKLSGAVQIDTQIFDKQPEVDDAPEVWAKFKKFHRYLEKTFPTVYASLKVETVNTHGLVYTWKGADKSLKPVLFTAHQDTVPIQQDTLGDWTYPPLEGHYDGEFLYGRGVSDCKNLLISLLETVELLLKDDYKPQRTVLLAFGFDEEASGVVGAAHIGKFLEAEYGKDSIYAIIDEGPGVTLDDSTDAIFATIGTGEKGYIDIEVELTTPGGHSSVPPDHTSIGIASELAYIIEKDPYQPIFTTKNPIFKYLQCIAVHDPKNKVPTYTKKAILRSGFDKFANSKVVAFLTSNKYTQYLIQTSQAIDIIRGGEKANALPETTRLLVNHRIAIESSVEEIKKHFVSRVIEVAKRHNLAVEAFGEKVVDVKDNSGVFKVIGNTPLDVAPVTPVDDSVWAYLAGVTRHVYEDLVFPELTYPIVSSPAIMTGNTDTRHYWNLTRNIFRYSPAYNKNLLESNIHSVDEKLHFDSHLQLVAFFYQYIQAVDTKKADNK